eukprot:scaffold22032_cov97-Isochrysis_galbana.AAC.3
MVKGQGLGRRVKDLVEGARTWSTGQGLGGPSEGEGSRTWSKVQGLNRPSDGQGPRGECASQPTRRQISASRPSSILGHLKTTCLSMACTASMMETTSADRAVSDDTAGKGSVRKGLTPMPGLIWIDGRPSLRPQKSAIVPPRECPVRRRRRTKAYRNWAARASSRDSRNVRELSCKAGMYRGGGGWRGGEGQAQRWGGRQTCEDYCSHLASGQDGLEVGSPIAEGEGASERHDARLRVPVVQHRHHFVGQCTVLHPVGALYSPRKQLSHTATHRRVGGAGGGGGEVELGQPVVARLGSLVPQVR